MPSASSHTGTAAGTAAESAAVLGFLWHDHPSPSSVQAEQRADCSAWNWRHRVGVEPHHHRFGPVTVGIPLVRWLRWLDQVDQLVLELH